METHKFIVTVRGCTAGQAETVMTERIGPDEDYGFDYRIGWDEARGLTTDYLTQPLSLQELREKADAADDSIKAVVPIDLSFLIDMDIESLNDHASNAVTGSEVGLMDIDYRAVGVTQDDQVLVEVFAVVAFDNLEED